MILKNKIFLIQLLFALSLFIIVSSCKKEEKKNPVINWENPANIPYGTPLSDIQLNATADVPGAFVYTPAPGTILEEGTNQELKVDFYPSDRTNYNSVSKTVKINVTPSVADIEGNLYRVVTIGTQTWMAENLKTTKYNTDSAIAYPGTDNTAWTNNTAGAYDWNNNDIANKATYGALYNWYAVNTGNLCPTGWHVPTDDEWKTLEMAIGMSKADADSTGGRGTNEGSKLAGNAALWRNVIYGGAMEANTAFGTSGFMGLPGGYRYSSIISGYPIEYGAYYSVGEFGIWWSSTEADAANAWARSLELNYCGIYRLNSGYKQIPNKNSGFSVRCLKD
jgi:uncharacterized protein (TIGR02145 family)